MGPCQESIKGTTSTTVSRPLRLLSYKVQSKTIILIFPGKEYICSQMFLYILLL